MTGPAGSGQVERQPDDQGLLATSVVVDLSQPEVRAALPALTAISTVTLAELSAGVHAARDGAERARRVLRLQQIEQHYDAVPVDAAAARSYGLIFAAVRRAGRSSRSRFADLLIAAVGHANRMPLYTRNIDDFVGLEELVDIREV